VSGITPYILLDITSGDAVLYLLKVGARCGASFINKKFRTWLQSKIGTIRYRKLDPSTKIAA
jgi:hypothetical protein